MKKDTFSLWEELENSSKLFSTIYNAFYCSKKTPAVDSADGSEPLPEVAQEEVTSRWFAALRAGDVTMVTEMLDQGHVQVNAPDESGWHPIHIVAWNGYSDICHKLLEKNCHINSPGFGNSTPLTLAAQQGHLPIVQQLIGANVDVQRGATLGENLNVTALHLAAQNGHTEIVRLLVKGGAVVNAQMTVRGIRGVTPLHLAVEAGHVDIMDILIEAGCDIHSSTRPSTESAC